MIKTSQVELDAFQPDTLNAMGEAFEQARMFAGHHASSTTIANAIIRAARNGVVDVSRLVKIGIEAGCAYA